MPPSKSVEWLVLLNPFAARGRTLQKEKLIRRELSKADIKFQLVITKSREDAIRSIHKVIEEGFRKFISVGGDGSFNCLVNGIFSQQKVSPEEITIAIIPIGTGNDWIKTHHIPKSISKAVVIIRKGNTQLHDVGVVRKRNSEGIEERFFINVAGLAFQGFVARRIESTSHWLKMGPAAFYFGLVEALFRFKILPMKIQFENETIDAKVFNISAGICKYAGGGMKLTPDAIHHDDLMDITLAVHLTKLDVILNLPRLFNGRYVQHKKITQVRTRKISFTSSQLIPIETDGEIFGYGNCDVEIEGRKIQVVVPG